jgi:hypothetical protein
MGGDAVAEKNRNKDIADRNEPRGALSAQERKP